MVLSRTEVKGLLEKHQLGPSRALGQNFLCDASMVKKIVRLSGVTRDDRVIEIGPGLGALTVALCDAGANVTAIEIDRYIIPALREVLEDREASCSIINQDVTTVVWDSILGKHNNWHVVANLPYNISTPLILDLLREQPALQHWLVMVQREAGERLVAEPGSRIYGIPSILTAYWGKAKIVGSVRPELFLPKPNVDSVLVQICRHEKPVVDAPFADLSFLVKTAFGKRRKMLRRSLATELSSEAIERAGISPMARPEQVGLPDWGRLAEVYCASKKQIKGDS